MFDSRHYVPILKGKKAEYGALRTLPPGARRALTPIIEVIPLPPGARKQKRAKTLKEHLQDTATNLGKSWGTGLPIFVDLLWLSPPAAIEDGSSPVLALFAEGRTQDLVTIPVTGLRRDLGYQAAIAEVVRLDRRGACIRLEDPDFGSLDHLRARLDRLLSDTGLRPEETDIVIDLKEIAVDAVSRTTSWAVAAIRDLPMANQWRTLTLAGTAFPMNLRDLKRDSVSILPRAEWAVWDSVVRRRSGVPRVPSFGDYATAHPSLPPTDIVGMEVSAQVRYTGEAEWVVLKGRSTKREGSEQSYDLCRELVMRSEYKGASFSWGDSYISQCACEEVGPGGPTEWRQVATSHHMALVVSQLANYPGL